MTSGQPTSKLFDAVYLPEEDVAVCFAGDDVRIGDRQIVLAGRKCVIRTLPDYYKRNFNPFYAPLDKRRFPRPPVGWLSWYCFFGDCCQKDIFRTLDFAARHFKKYGFEYVQIENWQKNSRRIPVFNFYHSLEWDPDKYPKGMRYVADRIHQKGLKAGLWVVPLGTGEEEFFMANREMFLTDRSGKPVKSWSGRFTLDPTHPKARRRIRDMLTTITRDWGYDYVKIDGLECGGDPVYDWYADTLYGRPSVRRLFHKKVKDPLRQIAELIRRSIGKETFFTVCGGKIKKNGKFVGIGNAARIGGDVFYEGQDPTWQAVVNTASAGIRAYHVHNIFWYNDPDVLSIRPPLSIDHARVMCTIVGLTGQLLFLGDILYELPAERVKMLQQLMPVCDTYPAHLARTERLKPVWNLVIKRDFEQWNVVAMFNWNEKRNRQLLLRTAELGLDPKDEYLVYDFWENRCVGTLHRQMRVALKKQSCKLWAIRRRSDHPQILSVDRHITQGAVCIRQCSWDQQRLALEVNMDLPAREKFVATVFKPHGYRLRCVTGKARLNRQRGNILQLAVSNGSWKCRFVRRGKREA